MESGNQRSLRIDSNVERGRAVRITVDGEAIPAYEGEIGGSGHDGGGPTRLPARGARGAAARNFLRHGNLQ